MPKPMGGKYDWGALKLEWLGTSLSLNKFRESKGIATTHFYHCVDVDDWMEAREKINQKAINKFQQKASTEMANKWIDYTKLWGAVKFHAAKILQQKNEKGEVIVTNPGDLQKVASTIETALKSERLIQGETTENVGGMPVQIAHIVQYLKTNEINGLH